MTMKPKSNKSPEDWVDKTTKIPMEEQMQKMMKKGRQPAEDNKHAGKTINAARQQQRREYTVGMMIRNAKQKRAMGMSPSPEEIWVEGNQHLFR